MRPVIGVVVFIVLLMVGFLATPNLFDFANPDYLLTLRRYQPTLDKLTAEQIDVEKKISDTTASISKLTIDLKQLSDEHTAKAAALTIKHAKPEEISSLGIDDGLRTVTTANERDKLGDYRRALEARKEKIESDEKTITNKIEAAKRKSGNLYLVSRALALGAIGALMSIFAKFLSMTHSPVIFEDRNASARMAASMAMGAIAAVVVMGLFFTGFISIFSHVEPVSQDPDFWKVTILCLLAGTFSDRLFQAAARRMEQYLGSTEQGTRSAPAAKIQKSRTNAAKKRGGKSRTGKAPRAQQRPTSPALVDLKGSDALAVPSERS